MSVGVFAIVAVVLGAVVLMTLVGRDQGGEAARWVSGITPAGLIVGDIAGGEITGGDIAAGDIAAGGGATSNGHAAEPVAAGSGIVGWESIYEITVLTRRELGRTWFGFEVRTETHGLLTLDGSRGPGQEFLAESHRFPGFDHAGLSEALTKRNSRVVCYSR